MVVLEVSGKGALRAFENEVGGHRWQRVPPNEKRGRRHTSTVTVAVMFSIPGSEKVMVRDQDIEWKATRGTGAGGQARNKTSNAVMMKHIPSGLAIRVETSRSQTENRETAKRLLAARLTQQTLEMMAQRDARARKSMVGSGQRGDKIRTVRLQDDTVTDHRTGKSMKASRYLKGEIRGLL